MISLFKNKVTVEQIHEEFDTAQDRVLEECDRILKELEIPTETQVERKAKMLEELGFIKAAPVIQAKSIFASKKQIQEKIDLSTIQAENIRNFKRKYPFEKFIPVSELDRICEKYGLIHAPVANYIKDIPEKNVLEMKRVKPLDGEDKEEVKYFFSAGSGNGARFYEFLNSIGKADATFTKDEINSLVVACTGRQKNTFLPNDDTWTYVLWEKAGRKGHWSFNTCERVDKEGLFIAAPKTHFDTTGLKKKSKHGFFEVLVTEVTDPVVFEYCKGDIVRIISKWGTEDDQSYLDPSLANEIYN